MNVKTQSRGFEISPSLGDHISSRLYLALGRHIGLIRQAEVSLDESYGTKGVELFECLVRLKFDNHASIVVQADGRDVYDAINSCARRARREMERHFTRSRQLYRHY